MKDLIAKLEAAPEGSRELDVEIAHVLGWVSVDADDGYNVYRHWLDHNGEEYGNRWPPEWTTSLDAKVPGENSIEMLLYPETGLYWALHDGPTGRFGGTGHTEVLARRIAGLKGMETK